MRTPTMPATLPPTQWLCGLIVSALLLTGCINNSAYNPASVPIVDVNGSSASQKQSLGNTSTDAPTINNTAQTNPDNTLSETATPPQQPYSNPAVASLLNDAAQARQQGDSAHAQALAERAQTLAPQEARTYLELSRIYAQRGDSERARQMALRGMSIVRDDPTTERELQQLSTP